MTSLTVNRNGAISIPTEVRDRYGFEPDTPVRLIETRTGILLIPLTKEPINGDLARELEEWQALGQDALAMFPYDEEES